MTGCLEAHDPPFAVGRYRDLGPRRPVRGEARLPLGGVPAGRSRLLLVAADRAGKLATRTRLVTVGP